MDASFRWHDDGIGYSAIVTPIDRKFRYRLANLAAHFPEIADFPLWDAIGTHPAKCLTSPETVRRYDPSGRLYVTYSSSSFVAQLGVGFISFIVSATCILAAVGPAHFAG